MVELNNLTSFGVNEAYLRNIAERVLIAEDYCKNCEISIVFVDAKKMQKLNMDYRKKDCATDVLSFEYEKQHAKKQGNLLGEIVICPDVIEIQAEQNQNSFEKELAFVLIHGVLHLLGYDHEKSGQERILMEEKQNKYFREYCGF